LPLHTWSWFAKHSQGTLSACKMLINSWDQNQRNPQQCAKDNVKHNPSMTPLTPHIVDLQPWPEQIKLNRDCSNTAPILFSFFRQLSQSSAKTEKLTLLPLYQIMPFSSQP
jgi:hypothetical protein